MDKPYSILLVGPAGAGKTPLGDALVRRGIWGRPCAHFDLGRALRTAAATQPPMLRPIDIDRIRSVLATGALFEPDELHIPQALLSMFLSACETDAAPLVVLNGLPRHLGQAPAVDALVDVRAIVHLVCPPETAVERIRTNAGGDRTGRTDDEPELVRRKHEIFRERTLPLIEYYRRLGADVFEFAIGPNTSADDLCDRLAAIQPAWCTAPKSRR